MLEGKNIKLLEIEEGDLEQLKEWRNSDFVRPYTRQFKPLTMTDQKNWFQSLSTSNNIMFTIVYEEILIGCCGLTYIDWKNGNAEISIYIGNKDWQRKGYASESLQLLLNYGFNELRLHRIYAIIFDYNKESIKLFEKNGFTFDGCIKESRYWDGKYHNELIYSVLNKKDNK